MPLDGTGMGKWAQRFAVYAEGKAPLYLVPVMLDSGVAIETGAASVPFVHDGEEEGAEPTETLLLKIAELNVRTRIRLQTGDLFTYGGAIWQVAPTERDVMAGSDWQFGAKLVRHAG